MSSHLPPDYLAVAAGSRYDLSDPLQHVRFGLALDFVRKAREAGAKLFITDNSLLPEVRERLGEAGAQVGKIESPEQATLGRAQSLEAAVASGCQFILLTELEKTGLIPYIGDLAEQARALETDILVTGRSAAGFASHPDNMRRTEPLGNRQLYEATGLDVDWFMGSHLLTPRAALLYAQLHREPAAPWFGGQMAAFARAVRRGMAAKGYVVERYRYPDLQRQAESNNPAMNEKRDMLLRRIVAAVMAEWNKP